MIRLTFQPSNPAPHSRLGVACGARRALASTLLAVPCLFALACGAARAAQFGVEPGSFLAKAHEPVPLKPVSGGASRYFSREADLATITAKAPIAQAGAHPDGTASFVLNQTGSGAFARPVDNPKDIDVDLPPGFVGNPLAVPACSRADMIDNETFNHPNACSPAAQVGVATLRLGNVLGVQAIPVYRVTTSVGSPATFGFSFISQSILLNPRLRSDGDYGLTVESANVAQQTPLLSATVTLWGVPASSVHDPERWNPATESWGADSPIEEKPFLINPSWCESGSPNTFLRMRSWQDQTHWLPSDPADPDYRAAAPEPTGCERLNFGGPGAQVGLTFQPAAHAADVPSGYDATLTLPFNENPKGLANPTLRDTEVTLPEGVAVNPSSANGLAACTSEQIGLIGTGFPAPNPIRFNEEPPRCPDASKIGTATVRTPLLEEPLEGAVYLAKQFDNPFDSLLAIYIAIDDAKTGITVKLAGHVEVDPETGQIHAAFADNPQLPFTEFDLHFFGGPRASLINPPTCGTKTTTTVLTPWSAPDTPPVTTTDSFEIEGGPGGGACPQSEAEAPNDPGFEAGSVVPIAGEHSDFVLKLSRGDGSQRLQSLNVTLPPGLTGKLAGIPYCPQAAIAQAEARKEPGEGALEQTNPSCPAESRLGTVTVAAGAGPDPVQVQGTAYLAGPYKGAPVSMAIVTPAVAGPFDLGVVAVRAALRVDPETAQITALSDPIPTILHGIPLDVRRVAVHMDRPRFTLNPTSCDPMQITGTAFALFSSAPLSNRFQVGGCRGLDFKPKLSLRLFGPTRRGGNPRLRAVVSARPGEANIARAAVTLPHSEFLDQSHIRTICTRVQFAEGNGGGEKCPPGSVYGHARAFTPLLDHPLEGPVYLRANGGERQLPDMVAVLKGPPSQPIEIDLVGFVDSVRGGIRNRFETAPDAPVSKFILDLAGGKKSLLENSTNICRGRHRATVKMDAHNGKVHDFNPLVRAQCGGKGKGREARRARHARLARASAAG